MYRATKRHMGKRVGEFTTNMSSGPKASSSRQPIQANSTAHHSHMVGTGNGASLEDCSEMSASTILDEV
jgi:hypothetical protein